MMFPDVKEQWVAALRSGAYIQGTQVLHRITGGKATYCCLGVLCDLALKAGISLGVQHAKTCECRKCTSDRVVYYAGRDDFLPDEVKDWAGLPSVNPVTDVRVRGLPATLSYWNDNGKTFLEIADIIERDF